MANLSFPPMSRLKTLKTFHLKVVLNEYAENVDADTVTLVICAALNGNGFHVVPAGQMPDALLKCHVCVVPTSYDNHGKPHVYSGETGTLFRSKSA